MKRKNLLTAILVIAIMILLVPAAFAGGAGPVNLGDNVWEGEQFDLSTVSDPSAGNVLFIHGDYDPDDGGNCNAATFETADALRAVRPSAGTWRLWEATPVEVAGMVGDLGTCVLHFTPVTIPAPIEVTGTEVGTATVVSTTTVTTTSETPSAAVPAPAVTYTLPGVPSFAQTANTEMDELFIRFFQYLWQMMGQGQPTAIRPAVPAMPAATMAIAPAGFTVEDGAVINRTNPIGAECQGAVEKAAPILVTSSTLTTTTVVMEDIGLTRWAADDQVCWPADPDQWYVAHGDINENGTCQVQAFQLGAPEAPNLGGTTRVYTVNGDVDLAVAFAQWAAQQYHGQPCPVVPNPAGR